jgi:branched-chain amino acid transport system substrate-binding protein
MRGVEREEWKALPVIWQRTAERCYDASIIAADRRWREQIMFFRPLIVALAAAFALVPMAYAEILIGLAGPLTGPNAWVGEQTERGVALAVADLNAAGGVLGQQVEVVTADDYCDGEQAVAAANKLVAVGVVFVVGYPCSGAAIPASEVHAAAGTLMISIAATNPLLTERGLDSVFRVVGRDDQQGTIAGNYLADRWGDKSIAIAHDGEAYGRGLAEETRRQLNARGVHEKLFTEITPGNADYGELVTKMSAVGADVLYYGGYAPEAGLIIRQARYAGDDVQLVVGDGVATEDFWLIAGPAGAGTLMTTWPDARQNPEAAEVVAKFRAANFEPLGGTLNGYATIQAWAQAVERAGTFELEPVAQTLRSNRFDTVLGSIGFDAKGDVAGYDTFAWYVWKDGEYTPVDPAKLAE